MAIDIKKIEEITFSQSFRGYNTDEVDDYLDELYEGAVSTNKKIQELNLKIKELENSKGDNAKFNDDSTNIIADAQIAADQIISNATQKAQDILANAQSMTSTQNYTSNEMDADGINKLKALAREMYEKQINTIDSISSNDVTEKNISFEKVEEPVPIKKIEKPSIAPTISFAGIINKPEDKIEEVVRQVAPKDIFSEINSISLNGSNQRQQETMTDTRQEPLTIKPEVCEEKKPESPDDIISQILNDNNRN